MLSLVASTIQLFVSTTHTAFIAASFLGQLIFTLLATLLTGIFTIINGVLTFLQILHEDNKFVFTEELPNLVENVSKTLSDQFSYISTAISYITSNVYSSVSATTSEVVFTFTNLIKIVAETFHFLCRTLMFIGATIYYGLNFVTIQIPLLVNDVVRDFFLFLFHYLKETYMNLLNFTNYLTDVPLESFIGIICAIIIVRLYVHYRDIIHSEAIILYWFVVRKVWYLYYAIQNYFTDSEVRIISRMALNQEVAVDDEVINEEDPREALCVVCQERQKCVLTLPCRHICLCRNCCMRLYAYQRTCPICRTFIYHSVNVYL